MIRKVKSFFRAVFGGRLEPHHPVIARRLAVCKTCERSATKADGSIHCTECKCPSTKLWPVAELHYKVGYARVRCPLGKWGEVARDQRRDVIPDEVVRRAMRPVKNKVIYPKKISGADSNGG